MLIVCAGAHLHCTTIAARYDALGRPAPRGGGSRSNEGPYATLSIADDQRYLICRATRLPKLDEFRQMLMEIAQTGMHSNIPRLLYDVRPGATLPDTMLAQDYGEAMAELLPHTFRVAMLGYEIDIHRKHLETVAINRGLYLKYFSDQDQALAWLFGGGT